MAAEDFAKMVEEDLAAASDEDRAEDVANEEDMKADGSYLKEDIKSRSVAAAPRRQREPFARPCAYRWNSEGSGLSERSMSPSQLRRKWQQDKEIQAQQQQMLFQQQQLLQNQIQRQHQLQTQQEHGDRPNGHVGYNNTYSFDAHGHPHPSSSSTSPAYRTSSNSYPAEQQTSYGYNADFHRRQEDLYKQQFAGQRLPRDCPNLTPAHFQQQALQQHTLQFQYSRYDFHHLHSKQQHQLHSPQFQNPGQHQAYHEQLQRQQSTDRLPAYGLHASKAGQMKLPRWPSPKMPRLPPSNILELSPGEAAPGQPLLPEDPFARTPPVSPRFGPSPQLLDVLTASPRSQTFEKQEQLSQQQQRWSLPSRFPGRSSDLWQHQEQAQKYQYEQEQVQKHDSAISSVFGAFWSQTAPSFSVA
eukprot:TRINITY_DN79498_c0_g1_i1.p1 TRINITY_DN79498_c0_g1~~TRINITY_DN79498_c0_g1_i1.p1  ORF type:complete len:468 (-),score=95.31 TRINITY_DN79498_c0_g1_i1:119-1360(-)